MQDKDFTKVEKILPAASEEVTAEDVETLRRRLLLFFGIGLTAALIACVADLFGVKRFVGIEWSRFAPHYTAILWSFPAVSLLAVLMLLPRHRSSHWLHLIDYGVLATYVILIAFISTVYSPTTPRTFAYSILLFGHAAMVPSRVWVQVILGITVTCLYPLGLALGFWLLPEIRSLWMQSGGVSGFRAFVLTTALDVFLLSAISVLITKTLYHFRFKLRRAQRLGNYILKGELGHGGMGTVYEASHAFLARPTAIKVLTPKHEDPKAALLRFQNEVRLCCNLTHPNTITIFDFGEGANQTFYYAMELLEGMDLRKLVQKFGPLPVNRTIYLLNQICGSLAEAHGMGILHRDIKPSNIFLTVRGGIYDFVKVLDFGLAKRFHKADAEAAERSGVFLGTPRYTAPECVQGSSTIDGRVDIYMMGNLIYFLLTGRAPFEVGSDTELMLEHLKWTPEPPSTFLASIPKEMDEIVLRCLRKAPEERFPTPGALAAALAQVPVDVSWSQEAAQAWWRATERDRGETVPSRFAT